MSALPPALLAATETAVLESLSRLLATKQISESQVRDMYVAWKVERSQAVQFLAEHYEHFEIERAA